MLLFVACVPAPSDDSGALAADSAADSATDSEDDATAGMVLVPAGSFRMGSPASEEGRLPDESPRTDFEIAAFRLDVTPVTVTAFAAVADELDGSWDTESSGSDRWYGLCNLESDRTDHPVNCTDWEAAGSYCALRGGRLPTEAEWEYAARAGTETAYWWGDAFDATRVVGSTECGGWACAGSTAPVVTEGERCNGWGLCDMSGGILQWNASEYRDSLGDYANEPMEPGAGEPALRGGSWSFDDPSFFRSAVRFLDHTPLKPVDYGLRCARDAE